MVPEWIELFLDWVEVKRKGWFGSVETREEGQGPQILNNREDVQTGKKDTKDQTNRREKRTPPSSWFCFIWPLVYI